MKLRNKETGEIKEAEARDDGIYLYSVETEQWFKYDLPLLAEGWEYYIEPKEPLIKDEKIRKAVRAWAEALDTESCSFSAYHDIFDFIGCGANYLRFDMSDGFGTYKLEDIPNGYYHIAELCGEEE